MPSKPEQSHIIYSINRFRHRKRIAAFDLDGTLIKPKSKAVIPKDVDDWQWLSPSVPMVVRDLYEKGYCIMIFTNQTYEWRIQQVKDVVDSLGQNDIPIKACVLFSQDYRKPEKKIWVEEIVRPWDQTNSFFCGDALGRQGDWSDVDKLFGENIGIVVESPEALFREPQNLI